jgi:hypothetical protein
MLADRLFLRLAIFFVIPSPPLSLAMPGVYRVGVNSNAKTNTQLVVNSDGTTSRVSTQQYAKTLQRHNFPTRTLGRTKTVAAIPLIPVGLVNKDAADALRFLPSLALFPAIGQFQNWHR